MLDSLIKIKVTNMKKEKFIPYIFAIIIFYALTYTYFSPLLLGKEIKGSDDYTSAAQSKALSDYQDEFKEWPRWTDNLFSGMPTTFIYSPNDGDLISILKGYLHNVFGVYPAIPLMLMYLGFFFLLRVLKVDPWLSIVGSIGYSFSTFFFILIPTGHYTQIFAISYIAPLIASVIVAYKYNRWLGAALLAILTSFELSSSHPQMAYYAVMIIGVLVMIYFVEAIKNKNWKKFIITTFILFISGIFGLGSNMNQLYPQYQYQKHSIRSASELTPIMSNSSTVEPAKSTSGLDYDYATSWSYGIDETFNILIPNLKGGGGSEYWGKQPFTSGPTYIGAVILFLFVLSLFLIKGAVKWWLIISSALSVLLCWGHYSVVYDFFFYHVPFFNKFRNPAWALIIATFTVPLGAALGLQYVISRQFVIEKIKKQVIYAAAIVGGISLLFWAAPGLAGNFEKQYYGQQGQIIPEHIVNAQQYSRQTGNPLDQQLITAFVRVQDDLVNKRKGALKKDAIRSFFFISIAFIGLYLFVTKRRFKKGYFIAFIGFIILIDLWGINNRFVNKSYFTRKVTKRKEIIQPLEADRIILQQQKDNRNYRVLDLTQPLDKDSHTIYFHPSLGGYNAAKLRRYEELMNHELINEYNVLKNNLVDYDLLLANSPIINMLNAKYIIYNPNSAPLVNKHALGIGWFVNNVKWANNANEEIKAIHNFNPSETVVINSKFKKLMKFNSESLVSNKDTLSIASYKMDHIVYNVSASSDRFVVFSEIFYPDWHAYIDGKEIPVVQCNYVLRGVEVPKGNHVVEFKYIASEYVIGSTISYFSSFAIFGIILSLMGVNLYKKRKNILGTKKIKYKFYD